jgi:hypothetical protein
MAWSSLRHNAVTSALLVVLAVVLIAWLAWPWPETQAARVLAPADDEPPPMPDLWPNVPDPAQLDAEVEVYFFPGTMGFTFRGERISIEEIDDYERGPGLNAGHARLDASRGGRVTRDRVAAALAWRNREPVSSRRSGS